MYQLLLGIFLFVFLVLAGVVGLIFAAIWAVERLGERIDA